MRKLVVIAMVLAVPTLAFATTASYSTNFDNAAYGDLNAQNFDGGTWTTVQSGVGTRPWAEVIDDPTGGGKSKVARYWCEDVGDTGDSVDSWVAFNWGDFAQSGVVTFTAEYFIETSAIPGDMKNDYWMATVKGDNTGNNQGEYWWQGNDGFNIDGGASFWGAEGGPIPLDQWFEVKRVLDYGNMTYKFYVNGVVQKWDDGGTPNEDFALAGNVLGAVEIYHSMPGDGVGAAWDPQAAMYVSDISLCSVTIPEPSLLLLAGLGLLALIRRK